jgi:GxxExxY protein
MRDGALGSGFLENVYHEALSLEFGMSGLAFFSEPPIRLTYKGHPLQSVYRADFLCFDRIIANIAVQSQICVNR